MMATTNGIPVANLQIFDTVNLTWENGPPMPKAMMQCAVTSIGEQALCLWRDDQNHFLHRAKRRLRL